MVCLASPLTIRVLFLAYHFQASALAFLPQQHGIGIGHLPCQWKSSKSDKSQMYKPWHAASHARLHSSIEDTEVTSTNTTSSSDDEKSLIMERVQEVFPEGEILTFTLVDHRPLGCTVEESLNEQDDYVFVSKVTPEGNAEKAGLLVGDVIVGLTGLFGGLTIVMDAGVDKITRLVSAVPDEDPLTIQIVRGTNVLERHETAVVDLCNMSGASEKEVESCVVDFLAGGYDADDDDENEAPGCDNDDGTECLIDDMINLWADEVPLPPTTSGITDQINGERTVSKPKPWSSRSSPSGTWVRDPKTGEMRNIDS